MVQCQSITILSAAPEDVPEAEPCIVCYEPFDENDHIKVHTDCGHANTCRQCIYRSILEQLQIGEWDLENLPMFHQTRRTVVITMNPILVISGWSFCKVSKEHFYKCPFRCHTPMRCMVHYAFMPCFHVCIELEAPGFSISNLNDHYIDAI